MGMRGCTQASLWVFLPLWHLLLARPVDASYLPLTAMNTAVSMTQVHIQGWLMRTVADYTV